jgi:hypothetical protein
MSATGATPTVTSDYIAGAGLSFDTTVSRSLVHKRAIEEVLISDFKQIGEDDFLCAGQLPRNHSYLNDLPGPYYDMTPIGEATRQAGLLIGHRFLDVREDAHYIFTRVGSTVDDAEAFRMQDEPSELVLHFGIRNKRVRRGAVVSYDGHTTAYVNGVQAGSVFGSGSLMPLAPYESFRRQMRQSAVAAGGEPPCDEPLDPERVGRRDVRNVVIGEFAGPDAGSGYTAALVVPLGHSSFFDHPQDHVPGSLLIEAIRQMAIAAACARYGLAPGEVLVAHTDAEFTGFAELDLRATVSAEVGELERSPEGQPLVPMQISISRVGGLATRAEVSVVGGFGENFHTD